MRLSFMLFICSLFLMTSCIKNYGKPCYFNVGTNFTMGDYFGKYLNVSFLKEGYSVEKHPKNFLNKHGEKYEIPYESDVRAYIMKEGNIQKKVKSLNNFEGYGKIDSKEKAIEFVRFRTSEETYFLFQPNIRIELFFYDESRKTRIGRCSEAFKDMYNIKNIEVVEKEGYFEIKRFLLFIYWPGSDKFSQPASLYYANEKVFKDGKYLIQANKISDNVERRDVIIPILPR